MPITTISYQPTSPLNSAYRPIVFRCKANTGDTTNMICPVVYCDVYINTIYYKTLAKTQFIANNGTAPEYEFDIQDALQEVMTYEIPAVNGSNVETFFGAVKSVFVRFRNAIIDTNNFTISEQVSPVMATSSSAAQQGAGTQSTTIVVTNTLIQHEENMDLLTLLNSYKTGTWDSNSFPLTKRPSKYLLGQNDSSYFPIITDKIIKTLCLIYSTSFGTATFCATAIVINDDTGGGGGGGGGTGSPSIVFIKWNDTSTNEDRICTSGNCPFIIAVDKSDPDNDIVSTQVFKSTDYGTTWVSFITNLTASTFSDTITGGNSWYKITVTDAQSHIVNSNILKYSSNKTSLPTYNFYYKALNPSGYAGSDSVTYIDSNGNTQNVILTRSTNSSPAPCTLIVANSISSLDGATRCKQITITCKSYTVTSTTSFSDPSVVGNYVDCNGIDQSIIITGTSTTFCANNGTVNVTASNLTTTDNGPC